MSNNNRKRRVLVVSAIIATIAVLFGVVASLLNPSVTRLVEADRFRAELEKETAKGLHFPTSDFGPIGRTGLLTARTESFHANKGWKAMTSFDAQNITASFNPLG